MRCLLSTSLKTFNVSQSVKEVLLSCIKLCQCNLNKTEAAQTILFNNKGQRRHLALR